MTSNISYIIIIIFLTLSFKFVQPNLQEFDVVLCRSCGHDIASSKYIFSKSSPSSHHRFNDTLFYKDEVLVDVFLSDFFFLHPVITVYHATCVGVGEWKEDTSWYPGYRWQPCVCPECGSHIGWVFEPIYPDFVEPRRTFYALILTSLISETFDFMPKTGTGRQGYLIKMLGPLMGGLYIISGSIWVMLLLFRKLVNGLKSSQHPD